MELSEKNRDDAIYGRNDWEFKVDHFKKNPEEYLAQIGDLEETIEGHKKAINTANNAAEYYLQCTNSGAGCTGITAENLRCHGLRWSGDHPT